MENCIFCKIINGSIPSYTIYEDDRFKVILDASPSSLGHCLVLPKNHAHDIFDLRDEDAKQLFVVIKRVAAAMKQSLAPDGINILQNNGQAAGQTVFHFHCHMIPRYENDNIQVGWRTISPSADEMTAVLNQIKEKLA